MTFKPAVGFVLAEEGGYVNDPKDPGGETKYGISKRQYPHLNIKNLTVDDATEIYYRDYWAKLPKMPEPLDILMFDAAVNCGHSNAVKFLQRVVRVADDGHWGPKSQAAFDRYPIARRLEDYQAERGYYYAQLHGTNERFGRGWMRRLMRSFAVAISD